MANFGASLRLEPSRLAGRQASEQLGKRMPYISALYRCGLLSVAAAPQVSDVLGLR